MKLFWPSLLLLGTVVLIGCPASRKPLAKPAQARAPLSPAARAECNKLYYRGVEQYVQGDLKLAMQTWKKVLALDPGHADAKRSLDRTVQELKALKKRGK